MEYKERILKNAHHAAAAPLCQAAGALRAGVQCALWRRVAPHGRAEPWLCSTAAAEPGARLTQEPCLVRTQLEGNVLGALAGAATTRQRRPGLLCGAAHRALLLNPHRRRPPPGHPLPRAGCSQRWYR